MAYPYELVNNHYIVSFEEGKKFLLDTGSPFSFWISRPMRCISIDGMDYPLQSRPMNFDTNEVFKCIGCEVDGFIGLDIIQQTSLSIYKEGIVDFRANTVSDGVEIPLIVVPYLGYFIIDASTDNINGVVLLDTGAKYGYGLHRIFDNKQPFSHVEDYNPILKHLDSDIYHIDININGLTKTVDVCDNPRVYQSMCMIGNLFMVTNVTTLFESVCVFDIQRGKLILK